MRSSLYCEYPVACLAAWIEPAIHHGQIAFLYDRGKKPQGYLTWAFLAEDTEKRVVTDSEVLFHLSEWNEGDHLWIMDLVVLDGSIREIVRQVNDLFRSYKSIRYLRRRPDGSVKKVVTLNRG
jgi:cytolysin-activating lysine-acyltransferase